MKYTLDQINQMKTRVRLLDQAIREEDNLRHRRAMMAERDDLIDKLDVITSQPRRRWRSPWTS